MSTLRVSAVKNRPRTPRGPGAGYSLLGRSAQSFPGGRALPRVPGPDGETGHKANGGQGLRPCPPQVPPAERAWRAGTARGAGHVIEPTFGYELVHADPVVRNPVGAAQLDPQVVGVEDGVVADRPQPFFALHPQVGVGPDVHPEVALECHHTTDGLLRHSQTVYRQQLLIAGFDDLNQRPRQEIDQPLGDADRPGPRAPAP